jgi:excisionase family DNA binding protein
LKTITQEQLQKLYEGIQVIATIFAEAHIEVKNKIDKPVSLDEINRQMCSQVEQGQKLLLTVEETTKILGISRSMTYEMIKQDQIPSIRLGRKIMIPRRKLIELIEC